MDFDPTAFLSMDMTEDQDVYTAPDVPQGFSPVKVPTGKIVVEGGLQMEQDMQIPVPMFGLLQGAEPEGEGEANESDAAGLEDPMHIDTSEYENNTTPQPSPGERTSSPSNKKIPASFDETRFRKQLFCGHFERVKVFRLHCSICDHHLGCAPRHTERQMRMHKLLSVVVCRKCFDFYGDVNFPTEDDSEMYCCWCGEGGDCFCCSTCPKIVCKKCVKRNFGPDKILEIDKNDDWSCFVCKPEDIWPHRAVMWGLQRWSKGLRQMVAMLSKEEKLAKLSMDTSHCCLKTIDGFTPVGLPCKAVLSKIPFRMISLPYQPSVRGVLERQEAYPSLSNGIFPPNIPYTSTTNSPAVTNVPGTQQQQVPSAMVTQQLQNISRAVATQDQQPLLRAIVSQQQQHQQQQQQIARAMAVQQEISRANQQRQQEISRANQQRQQEISRANQQQQQQISRALANQQQQQQQISRAMVTQQQTSRAVFGYHVRSMVHRNMVAVNKRPAPYSMNRPPILQPPALTYLARPPPHRLPPPVCATAFSQPSEVIDLERDSDSHPPKPPLIDISLLESGVRDVKNVLEPLLMNLDQFNMTKNDLANDFAKLTSYSERLSYNIKIAICNLAKVNTDLVESQRKIIDSRVSTVVNNMQLSVVNNATPPTVNGTITPVNQNGNKSSPVGPNPHTIIVSSPKTIEVNPNPSCAEQTTPATPLSSTGDEVEDVGIVAMLCETILEVGENKENKDDANKDQATPVNRRKQVNNKPVKGKPNIKTIRKKPRDQNVSTEIQVIDLIDDDEEVEEKFDEAHWCQTFKIVPCEVVLENLEILKFCW